MARKISASSPEVREAIGSDRRLMVDVNHYDALGAIRFVQRAVEYDIDYRHIRARQPISLAGGETWHTRWGFREPIESRCVDIVQPDLRGTGGFTEARRIADLAALHGIRVAAP